MSCFLSFRKPAVTTRDRNEVKWSTSVKWLFGLDGWRNKKRSDVAVEGKVSD